ncbi:Transposon TX1 uncharacterized 149 kDa protein ORF 2 [Takifugu flavidus]|uniref:Transposon TX1 uncharacterized 149 kDa protein ORF 2 n=1 Tax=Takifugu flavidus TaxID=433684 RepID=A0A5C6MWT9_9TELE|nr:Transposon TX1 uncharacterized 149 kDa protein ORF 2 [Takifugu flavidus]
MNTTVMVFMDSTDKADQLVEAGVVINGALPLSNPVKKVVASNVPPFFKNDLLLRELSRHGRVVSPTRLIPLGCKSPLLRHVMSFRRQVSMVLNSNKKELNLALCFRGTMAGTIVEVKEPAGLQGDHVDLRSERLTRELVEQTATRVAETVRDMEDNVSMCQSKERIQIQRDSLSQGGLPLSCRRAVLTLLRKKGDLQDVKNWCPVSLLCTDYKPLSKVLATWLRKVIERVIHEDQTY